MSSGDFVSYLRVSTTRQGESGLGLEAQRSAVRSFIGGEARIVREFVEVESGRKSARPVLEQALAEASLRRVPLIVAKVDRLTRSVGFLHRIIESGVEVRFCDLPSIEGAVGKFMLTQMAAVAELEAGLISKRTKDALAAAKVRGVKLGGRRANQPGISSSMRQTALEGRRKRAADRAKKVLPIVDELRARGVSTLRGLAEELGRRGITAPRGGKWSPAQVSRLVEARA